MLFAVRPAFLEWVATPRRHLLPPTAVQFRDKCHRVDRQDADLLRQPAEVDDHLLTFPGLQPLEDEEIAAGQLREPLSLHDLHEESQQPVGEAYAKDEEVTLLKGLA